MLNRQPILKVNNLSKSFGGLRAVSELNLEVYANEILGLIGPNGAGKSTTFDLITGLQKSDQGEVEMEGERVTRFKPHVIARHGLSRTFQKVKIFTSMTVEENVLVGALIKERNVKKAREKVSQSLELTEISDKKDLPVFRLNLVDRKKVELSRALSTSPKILLLDEVMCGLNPHEMDVAIDLVRRINQMGITIVIVEHVMKVIMTLAQRIAVLDYGVKIAEGTPREIRSDPQVIKAYLGGGSRHA